MRYLTNAFTRALLCNEMNLQPSCHGLSILYRAHSNPEVIVLTKGDSQLSKALQSSKRIGSLLLKQEEHEAEKVKQLSEELLKKHR